MKKQAEKQNALELNPLKFALSMGIITSGLVFGTTLLVTYGIFSSFYVITSIIFEIYGKLGYSVSIIGSILGALFSFIDAFIIGFIFAWLYNKIN